MQEGQLTQGLGIDYGEDSLKETEKRNKFKFLKMGVIQVP